MRKLMLLCAWLCAVAFAVGAHPVQAAGNNNAVSYVASIGNDSNTCATAATACGSFNVALNNTQSFGEIICVDNGYKGGAFTITQSVTIDCASTMSLSYGEITVNGAGIVVRLRNLSIDYRGGGTFGIDAKNMAALYIENCVIINNQGASPFLGIKFEPSAGEALLSVTNSVISANGNVSGGTGGGIEIAPTSGATASVVLDGVKMVGNVYGIGLSSAGGTIVGALRHSSIAGSNVSGLVAVGGGSPIFFTVDDSSILNNPSFGIQSLGTGVNVQIDNSTITGNGTGVSGSGITSFKNNQISGNATDGIPIPAVSAGLQ